MVKAINSYVIQMNRNHSYDVNYRNFETIGCGTVLLTNWNDMLDELGFVNGENCIIYDDQYASIIPSGLPEMVQGYLDDPEKLQTIAQKGLELSKKHTYIQRAKAVIDMLNGAYDEQSI